MREKKFANEPLLYIHQPYIGTTKAPMQHNYMSQRKTKEDDNSTDVIPTPKRVNRRHNTFRGENTTEQLEATDVEKTQGTEDKETSSTNEHRKQFKEMDIKERINYFLNRPDFAPQVRSEIRTKGRTYRGIVLGMEDDIVVFKKANRATPVQIPLEEITEVQIIGF